MTKKQKQDIEKLKIYLRRSKKKLVKNGLDSTIDINSSLPNYGWWFNYGLGEPKH